MSHKNQINSLANIISGLSLLFGFISIIFSLKGKFIYASWAIIISVVSDGLDGQVARLNPEPSEFGKELDSLIDVVSFGIAPAVVGYFFIDPQLHFFALPALFVYLFCSILRLAKYNITPRQSMSSSFIGLPTTVSAGVLASFILMCGKKEELGLTWLKPHSMFLGLVLFLAALMVSKVRYLNLDGIKVLLRRNIKLSVIVATYIIASIFTKRLILAGFSLFLIYLLFSPFVVKSSEVKKDAFLPR